MNNRWKDEATVFIEDRLKEPLLHGDAQHRKWLEEELRKWIPDLAFEFESYFNEGQNAIRYDLERYLR